MTSLPGFRHRHEAPLRGNLSIPSECQWAIEELFSRQRVDVRRGNDAGSVTRTVRDIFTESLAGLLPEPSKVATPVIVDIGPGLAMYHVYISRVYSGAATHVLVDRSANGCGSAAAGTKAYHRRCAGYRDAADGFQFYTSLECASSILVANGVRPGAIRTVNATRHDVRALGAESADVVMSLASMGFHYSVEAYLQELAYILKPGGTLILTITRENKSGGRDQLLLLQRTGFLCASDKLREARYHQLVWCTLPPWGLTPATA